MMGLLTNQPACMRTVVIGLFVGSAAMVVRGVEGAERPSTVQPQSRASAVEREGADRLVAAEGTDSSAGRRRQDATPGRRAESRQLAASDYQDDWRQAAATDDRLGERLRSHHVRAVNGVLRGKMLVVNPVSGQQVDIRHLTIHLLQNGASLASATSSSHGEFFLNGVQPGVYGLVAAGADGFAAYSLQVIGDAAEEEAERDATHPAALLQQEITALDVETLAVPPDNFHALKELIRNHIPASVDTVDYLEPAREGIPAGARYFEVREGEQGLPAGPAAPPVRPVTPELAAPGTTIRHHAVSLQVDDRLVGRVRRLHPGTGRPLRPRRLSIHMLRNNQVAARATVDEATGVFEIEDFKPGMYSLVAVAREYGGTRLEGFAAFSIAVLPAPAAVSGNATRSTTPVSLQPPVENVLEIDFSVVGWENLAQLRNIAAAHLPGGLAPVGAPGAAAPGMAGAPGAPPAASVPAQGIVAGEGGAFGAGGAVSGANIGSLGSAAALAALVAAGISIATDEEPTPRPPATPDSP